MPLRLTVTTLPVLAAATIAALVATLQPLDPPAANGALGIGLICLTCWATGVIPEHLTALIFFTLVTLTATATPDVAFAGFLSSALWMVFTGLVLGVAIEHSGLGGRIADGMAGMAGTSYAGVIAGVIAFAILLSFVMPAAMGRVILMIPILTALAGRLGFAAGTRGRTGIVFAFSFGTFLPAFGILPSNVPNMVLSGAAESLYGTPPTYGEYLLLHFPVLGLAKAVLLWAVVTWLYAEPARHRPEPTNTKPFSATEWKLAALLALGLGLWVTDFLHHISPAWIGLAMVVICLFPRSGLVPEDTFRNRINFAPMFYVAGIISLGSLISQSGLGSLMAGFALDTLPLAPGQPATTYATLGGVSILLGLVTTLPGIPAVMTPLADDIATASGLSLAAVLMTQVIGFSTVVLPYQSPPLTVATRLAGESLAEAAKVSLWTSALTVVLLLPLNFLWWRLLGWV